MVTRQSNVCQVFPLLTFSYFHILFFGRKSLYAALTAYKFLSIKVEYLHNLCGIPLHGRFVSSLSLIIIIFFFCLFAVSWAAPAAYGGSQARGQIGAVAIGLRQSHSNVGSELHLQPTPQLMATLDP